jgi:hypothetical protein
MTPPTLMQLLEIDRSRLDYEHEEAVLLAERLFAGAGSPTGKAALCRALERILQACQRRGVRYPPVFLARKKQLERGVWAPAPQRAQKLATEMPIPSASSQSSTLPPIGSTPDSIRAMIADLKRTRASQDVIAEWEERLTRLVADANAEAPTPISPPGPQYAKRKTA